MYFLSEFALTAPGCVASQVQAWSPVAVDNETKAAHREPVIWPLVTLGAPNWPVNCWNRLSPWAVEGYRVMSLSSRSLEEMRRRCMVRVMFSKWPLPHTQPFESARQKRTRSSHCSRVEQRYRTACHLLEIKLVSVTCGFPWIHQPRITSCVWHITFCVFILVLQPFSLPAICEAEWMFVMCLVDIPFQLNMGASWKHMLSVYYRCTFNIFWFVCNHLNI